MPVLDTVEILEPHNVYDALEFGARALRNKRNLIIIGKFSVTYSGRAGSKLGFGERLLILKQDGSLIIHRPSGFKPINWQPPGSIQTFYIKDNMLHLKSVRKKVNEVVIVTFKNVYVMFASQLRDRAVFKLEGAEEQIKKALLLSPDMIENGFKPITDEKQVKCGFIDIFGVDKNGKKVVVEIKSEKADVDAVEQLKRYVNEIGGGARGILVAPEISDKAMFELRKSKLEFRRINVSKCIDVLSREGSIGSLSPFLD